MNWRNRTSTDKRQWETIHQELKDYSLCPVCHSGSGLQEQRTGLKTKAQGTNISLNQFWSCKGKFHNLIWQRTNNLSAIWVQHNMWMEMTDIIRRQVSEVKVALIWFWVRSHQKARVKVRCDAELCLLSVFLWFVLELLVSTMFHLHYVSIVVYRSQVCSHHTLSDSALNDSQTVVTSVEV